MPFLAEDAQGEKARIHWLIRLRWVAVLGVFTVVIAAGPVLGVIPEFLPLLTLVGFLGTWNLVLAIRERRGLAVQSAGRQVAVDLGVLAALLFFSGGLENPFSIFIVVHAILGGILMPARTAVKAGILGAALTLLLAVLGAIDALPEGPLGYEAVAGTLSLWAVAAAQVITIGVALNFTVTIMEHLRARAREAARYHQEAERERQKLAEVVRSLGAAMVILDPELRVQRQNPRAEQVLGGLTPGCAFQLPDGETWPTLDGLLGHGVIEREWSGTDGQGRPRLHHVSASPVRSKDGTLEQVIVVFTDITDRRAAERQLHRTEKLAALGRLAAGVAHEINTPLGSVRILGSEAQESLERAMGGSSEAALELREHLGDIRQETERISTLVRRLLDLSHPGDDHVELCDLDRLAEDVVRLVSVRSPKPRGRIRTEGAGVPPVRTSPDRLRQVLMNVLDNAIDATQKNGGEIIVRTGVHDGQAQIEVEDRGEGIKESDLMRVFEPFFTTKGVGEGTGLGLYVSYEIMKNLGGEIGIESRPGHGTRVILTLPVEPSVPGVKRPLNEIAGKAEPRPFVTDPPTEPANR
jgi:signal transduction histidine kinase